MGTDAGGTATDLGYRGGDEEAAAAWCAAATRWAAVARRPTEGDIAIYRGLAGPGLGGRVLILGVTPELRDLVAEAGGQPVLLDSSAAMHAATTALLRCADPSRETWIEGDWRTHPWPEPFDLVLGDMVWWALPVSGQRRLRDAIRTALTPKGRFVGRVGYSEPGRATEDPLAATAAHLSRLGEAGADPDQITTELLYWLYDHTADHAGRRLDRERTRALLIALAGSGRFSPWASVLRNASDRLIGADWTAQPRAELLDLLGEAFALIAEVRAADYASAQHPVLALRPL
jgi:hypothetical protein